MRERLTDEVLQATTSESPWDGDACPIYRAALLELVVDDPPVSDRGRPPHRADIDSPINSSTSWRPHWARALIRFSRLKESAGCNWNGCHAGCSLKSGSPQPTRLSGRLSRTWRALRRWTPSARGCRFAFPQGSSSVAGVDTLEPLGRPALKSSSPFIRDAESSVVSDPFTTRSRARHGHSEAAVCGAHAAKREGHHSPLRRRVRRFESCRGHHTIRP